jgi:endonuclease VIII
MAEGDTIHRVARRFEATLVGSPVSVRTPGPRRPDGRRVGELEGRTLESAEARGKHLLLRFEGDLVLHSHLGMRGAWHLYVLGARWRKPARSAWIALSGGGAEAVNFGGSSLRLVRVRELARDPRLAHLGPDILAPDFTDEIGAASLRRTDPRRELGDALLDQTLIAGVGNIFKSEGCWSAKLDPWRRVRDVSDDELLLVVEHTRKLMAAAVESGRQPKRVYRRSRMPCPRDRGPIRSRPQGDDARTTYWCPRCQK